jgi:hypothetical protein
MAYGTVGGGRQLGDGNASELILGSQGAPATMTSTAAITAAQLATGIIVGSPGGSAATYTLPTVALWEAVASNSHTDSAFDFFVINLDGSGSGIITMAAGTGWTAVGILTVAVCTAPGTGSAAHFRARKTGTGAWTVYRLVA